MKPEHIRSRVGRPAIYLCLLFGAIGPVSAQQYWDWSAAVTLGQVVNSSYVEETPFLSKVADHWSTSLNTRVLNGAAELLGVRPTTLVTRMKKMGLRRHV